jgi:DNA-binding protein H-NS
MTLKSIERRIEALKLKAAKIKKREKKPALRQIARLMREHGITVDELGGTSGRGRGRPKGSVGRKTGKVKPMYRNPKTGETWSGRGRAARWVAAAEKAGHKRSEFLIRKA